MQILECQNIFYYSNINFLWNTEILSTAARFSKSMIEKSFDITDQQKFRQTASEGEETFRFVIVERP